VSAAYESLERRWDRGEVVVLDGGMGSELERVGYPSERNIDLLWGTRALYEAPELTREVHRRYVRAGADVLTTNTWRIDGIPEGQRRGLIDPDGPSWQDAARLGVALAREAASEAGRGEGCAVAFSLFLEPVAPAFVPELAEAVAGAEPDLILVETEVTIPESLEFPEYAALLATGLPLWVSYRWTAAGPPDLSHIGIGPPPQAPPGGGGLLGLAAERFERMGVSAVLVNCLPPEFVPGTLPLLRRHTRLPLGVYPNLGTWINPGWEFDDAATPESLLAEARRWQQEGASIIGGCCGTTAEHIAALAAGLREGGGVTVGSP
jgi:S-methylmethionine-dependent homocysteine/selenocysteine methylase